MPVVMWKHSRLQCTHNIPFNLGSPMYIVRLGLCFFTFQLRNKLIEEITRIISVLDSSTTVLVCDTMKLAIAYEIFSNIWLWHHEPPHLFWKSLYVFSISGCVNYLVKLIVSEMVFFLSLSLQVRQDNPGRFYSFLIISSIRSVTVFWRL
jgi:hypothetical protein